VGFGDAECFGEEVTFLFCPDSCEDLGELVGGDKRNGGGTCLCASVLAELDGGDSYASSCGMDQDTLRG